MPCYSPLTGWRSKRRNPNGKRSITFNRNEGFVDQEVTLPCGQCIGCRLEHSRQWAIRCVHEAQMHEKNCFITLTYNNEKIPTVLGRPTLKKEHFVKFMKRLRRKYGEGIKFYGCGEYGSQNVNPHYHICLFGHDFDDKVLFKEDKGNKIYLSADLQELWTDPKDDKAYGFVTVGSLTFETAAYTARYCMKKQKGKGAKEFYEVGVDLGTGEIHSVEPEFALMSRRPGIGRSWLEEFKKEVINNDSIVINQREVKPPKYYDNQIEKTEPDRHSQMKADRRAAVKKAVENNSLARLYVRGLVKEAQIKNLKKEL